DYLKVLLHNHITERHPSQEGLRISFFHNNFTPLSNSKSFLLNSFDKIYETKALWYNFMDFTRQSKVTARAAGAARIYETKVLWYNFMDFTRQSKMTARAAGAAR
ncbi:hypothetical protein J6590_022552, partial [Homalodisca vitripennis]